MKFNSNIKLLVGLGNPGKEYKNTYHNAGFLALDYLVKQTKLTEWRVLKSKNFAYLETDDIKLVKPLTFMNNSGRAVSQALKFFRLSPEETLIIHDDSDLNLGKFKLSFNRGAGGHLGIESIIRALKTKKFWRLRLGIRKQVLSSPKAARCGRSSGTGNFSASGGPASGGQVPRAKAEDFVLKQISPPDKKILYRLFSEILIPLAKQKNGDPQL
jgi:PTH1 family peptidyl-tRNA hydrolase